MIRINLLPQAKKQARAAGGSSGSGQLWAGIYLGALVLCGVGLAILYSIYSGQLEAKEQRNTTLNRQITELRQRSAGLEEVQARLAASQSLEQVVESSTARARAPCRW